MPHKELHRLKTIAEFHRIMGLSRPEHPLISFIDYSEVKQQGTIESINLMVDFYCISIKKNFDHKFHYGQQLYDFDSGVMLFGGPKQIFSIETNPHATTKTEGWLLLIQPDFLWKTALSKTIKHYEFFNYSVNEALFLSEKEEAVVNDIVRNIKQEYQSVIDKYSQSIIISQIETLLNYSERFYQRQFITRKKSSHQLLDKMEDLLNDYFSNDKKIKSGLPTVQFISESLNVSPNYLSALLKSLTGQSTQQHIHEKLIEKAKEKLSTTELSISEIAYELGFEQLSSFSKLFKTKTKLSPLEFRQSFN